MHKTIFQTSLLRNAVLRRSALLLLAALAFAPTAPALDVHAEVSMAPLSRSYAMPPLARRQGWLTISNRDWQPFFIVQDDDDLTLHPGSHPAYGGVIPVPSGTTVTVALEKDTYKLRGNNGNRLNVRVREGQTTTLSLEPFGYAGATGLMAVANDRGELRDEVLFDAMTVVVQAPPPVIIERPAPPIIVTRPPVVIERPRPPVIVSPGRPGFRPPVVVAPGRPGGFRPGRPPRPGRPGGRPPRRDNDGFSFSFDLGKLFD